MKKFNFNRLIIIGLAVMIVLGVILFLSVVGFQDTNYQSISSFAKGNPTEETIDQCIAEFGEPRYIDETVAVFEGGRTWRLGCIYEYKEYELLVFFDKDGCITEAKHVCILDIQKGVSSLLNVFA